MWIPFKHPCPLLNHTFFPLSYQLLWDLQFWIICYSYNNSYIQLNSLDYYE